MSPKLYDLQERLTDIQRQIAEEQARESEEVQIGSYIPRGLYEALDAYRRVNRVKQKDVVRQALERFLSEEDV